jgi:hypothetical protein
VALSALLTTVEHSAAVWSLKKITLLKRPQLYLRPGFFTRLLRKATRYILLSSSTEWKPFLTIPDVARILMKLLREPELLSENGGWHRTNQYCRSSVDPAAFVPQARKMTLQHAFGAHSHTMSLVYSAAVASSIFIGRKIAREFRIMHEDAHLMQRQRVLESALLQLTVTQRTRMLHCTCSTPLSFLAFRLALADKQRDVRYGRWVIALVMKRWFRGAAWQIWTRLC